MGEVAESLCDITKVQKKKVDIVKLFVTSQRVDLKNTHTKDGCNSILSGTMVHVDLLKHKYTH